MEMERDRCCQLTPSETNTMYWLDTVILIILGIAAIWGAFAGLLWQVSRIITVVLALYCSITFNDLATPFVQEHLMEEASPLAAKIVSYILVFLIVCLVLLAITMSLEKGIEKIKLQWLNRALGAATGAFKAAFLLGIVLYGLKYLPGTNEAIEKSALSPVLTAAVDFGFTLMPLEYRDNVDSSLEETATTVETLQKTSNLSLPKKPASP
jgi:uncharacterized membrane protein required for colicin V production